MTGKKSMAHGSHMEGLTDSVHYLVYGPGRECPTLWSPNIFIVEDEIVFAEDLRETLEGHGYSVCGSVTTGEEALLEIPRKSPDLILIDIVLAGKMNGIDLADAICSRADIPVIFLTSNIEGDTVASAKYTRPYGYIPKPFEERVLFSTIEIALFKHRADRQIRESENRYRTFVENIQGIAYRYDRNNVLDFFHGAIEKISGYSPADFTEGRLAWADIIHTDDRGGAAFPGTYDDPALLKSKSREYRIVRKDGGIRWIHDQTQVMYRSGSMEPLFEGVIYDVTPLKLIEADLKKSCDIRTVILLMSSHFFRRFLKKGDTDITDEKQRLLSSLYEILGAVGYEMDVPVISLYERTIDPEGHPLVSEILRCVHPKHIPPVELRNVREFPYTKNGFARWDDQLIRGYPVFGTIAEFLPSERGFFQDPAVTSIAMVPFFCEDRFFGFIQAACFNDAHAWTESEISSMQIAADVIATIIESGLTTDKVFSSPNQAHSGTGLANPLPSTLMDAAVDIVFVADSGGKILHMNRAGLELFAADKDTGDPQSARGKFTGCIRENIEKRSSPLPLHGEGPIELELAVGDRQVSLELTLSPVTGSTKDRQLFMGIARDVTRQKTLQRNQWEIQKKLLLMQKIFRHDMNNQITAILGYLSLSKHETNNPAFLGFIEKEERIVESIRKSMGFTKIYENLGDNSARWIDVGEIFSSAWAGLAPAAVRLELPGDPVEVLADPLFRNVVFNLLDNSLRHGGEGLSEIRVSLSRGDEMVIRYEDNGAGILAENKEKIFNRGFYTNNGFGLLLIREILSLTGLGIRETGTPGKGACFEITVPKGMWRPGVRKS